jgi:hypothetical protein
MAQYTVYKSTDASAPVLSGTTDSLCALLDACLVTGYGAKVAAGWTKTYDGTNKSVFRPASGTRFYLRVLDDGSLAGGARDACIRGYETMSDVDTGTNPFPTVAQRADSASTVRKSTSADATARAWTIVADGKTVMAWIMTGDNATSGVSFYFGDFVSYVANDAYNCICISVGTSTASALTTIGGGIENVSVGNASATGTVVAQHHIARKSIGTGGSEVASKWSPVLRTTSGDSTAGAANGTLVFPNTADGKLWLSRLYLLDTTNGTLRGYLRGVYGANHAIANFNEGDTFSGVGTLVNRTFTFAPKSYTSGGAANGIVAFETSNTLD